MTSWLARGEAGLVVCRLDKTSRPWLMNTTENKGHFVICGRIGGYFREPVPLNTTSIRSSPPPLMKVKNQVMKSDGKILEYKAAIKVHQVLTEFSGHVISDSLPVLRHLHPNTKLLPGHLYHLVSSPKKKVSFADPQVQDSHGDRESGVVRVKLVITKKQLQDMLQKGGVSVNNVLSLVHGQEQGDDDVCEKTDDGFQRWKPALESIPEVI